VYQVRKGKEKMARKKSDLSKKIKTFISIAFKPEVDSDGDSFDKKAFDFGLLKRGINQCQ